MNSNGEKVLLARYWCRRFWGFSQECPHHSCSHRRQLRRPCPNHHFPSHSCRSVRYFQVGKQLLGEAGWCTWIEKGLCVWSDWRCCEDNQRPGMGHLPPAAEDWPAPASKSPGWTGLSSSVCFSRSPRLSQCCQKLSPMCCQTKWRSQWTVLSLFLRNKEKQRLEESLFL